MPGAAGAGRARAADTVLTNGVVFTPDRQRRPAQALAVRDGRIALVGADAEVGGLVGSGTSVIDVGGAMVLPGFIDAHAHVSAAVSLFSEARLSGEPRAAYCRHRRRLCRRPPAGRGRARHGLERRAVRRARATQGGARRHRRLAAGGPRRPGRPRAVGQLPGAGAGRHRPRHARSPGRGDRARPADRRAVGDAPRDRRQAGRRPLARPLGRRVRAGHHDLPERRGRPPGHHGRVRPGHRPRRAGRPGLRTARSRRPADHDGSRGSRASSRPIRWTRGWRRPRRACRAHVAALSALRP